jgi:hypothetical protein
MKSYDLDLVACEKANAATVHLDNAKRAARIASDKADLAYHRAWANAYTLAALENRNVTW